MNSVRSRFALNAFLGAFLAGLICPIPLIGAQESPTDTPMSLSGFSVSQSYEIEDGLPIDLENPYLMKLLHRVNKISLANVVHYASYSSKINLNQIVEYPRKHRLWMFKISGRAKKIVVHKYAGAEESDSLKGCYIVDIQTDDGMILKVVSRSLPSAWATDAAVDYRAEFHGFFLQHVQDASSDEAEKTVPLFISNRVAWFPDKPDPSHQVDSAQILLASQGVDIGLFDIVRQRNTQSLGKADAECFYQMLRAVKQIDKIPGDAVGFLDLMQDPKRQFGNAVTLVARCRRCVPIEISDEDIRKRYGIDRYFELDMMIPIDGQVVVKNPGGNDLTYQTRYPLTVCVAKLPRGTTPEDISETKIEINGFFYRFWKYQTEFTDDVDGVSGQVSPLIIGLPPTLIESSTRLMDVFLVTILLGTVVGVLGLLWWFRESDRNRPVGSLGSKEPLPERVDFSGVIDNLED